MSNALAVQEPVKVAAPELCGFYENMPFEEYAKVDALNGSSIVHMRRSPMKYRHEKDNPTPPSPAMQMGTIVHRLILEPELVGDIAVWGLEPDQKVRNGRAWDSFREFNEGMTILTVAEYEAITGQATAALRNAPIRKYASAGGITEVSMFWRHPYTKRRYKARIDKLIPEAHTIFDLKSTRDCHSRRFGAQAYSLGYHIKLSLYAQGYEVLTGNRPKVLMGALDSKAPHESAVYRVTEDVLLQGIEELDILVEKLGECEKSGEWPGEYQEETDLLLPAWTRTDDWDDVLEN